MRPQHLKHLRQNFYATLAAFIWGTAFVAQSVGAEYVRPFTFNAARSAVATVFLLVLCVIRRRWNGTTGRLALEPFDAAYRKKLGTAALFCGLALGLASFLQQKGLESTSAGKAGFITALYIVLVPIAGIFLGRRAPLNVWIAVPAAAAGLYCLCVTGGLTVEAGDILVLLCAAVFTVQILLIDRFSPMVDGMELSCLQFLVVTAFSTAGVILSGETVTPAALFQCAPQILYTGILSSGVAYTLQILAQRNSNPTVISLLLSLEAVFATLTGAVLLHERMTGREIVGCVLMLLAVMVAQLPPPGQPALPDTQSPIRET